MVQNISRRQFIRKSLLVSAGLLPAGSLGTMLGCASHCPKRITSENRLEPVLADLHVHPLLNEWLKNSPLAVGLSQRIPNLDECIARLFNETEVNWQTSHDAGVDMMCVAHLNPFDEWLSMPTDPNPDAPRNTIRMMDLLEQELKGEAGNFAKLAHNYVELEKYLKIKERDPDNYRIAVVHALEGGHALGGTIDSLEEFARRGVAMIGITHFFNKGIATSANSYPFFPDTDAPLPNQGLSEFGKQVVACMEDLGIIVDVAHATSTAVRDILRVAKKPFICSHTSARTLGDHPHSMYDEYIKEIANRGGIVGVTLYPYWLSNYAVSKEAKKHGSLEDVVKNIRYMYKICDNKHKHLGIGTDFAGGITPPNDLKCYCNIDKLRQLLMREFDDQTIVDDIMANNVIRFFKENWRSGL